MIKKFNLFSVLFLIAAFCADAGAATTSRRGNTSGASTPVTTPAGVRGRAAVIQPATGGGRATMVQAPTTQRVGARAATQKVINTGTKVAAANSNVVVSEECKTKYYGCMDSFCMLDNTSGGRCLCSDRNAELDSILNEIQRLDEQTYTMATAGVERIEMGADADAVIAETNKVAQSFLTESKTSEKRRALDLANWNSVFSFDEDDDEMGLDIEVGPLDGKTGNKLHDAVYDLCAAQMPECGGELSMLKLMYSQQIRSDCTAYENSLKQQRNASQQKLLTAESAMREAALEQYRAANKYDLGQCVTEYKKCMVSTGGCGSDFSSCVAMPDIKDTGTAKYGKNKQKIFSIKGNKTSIDVTAATYDIMMAKKPICEFVTKSCVNVKDQVWDAFLKDVAPQLKSAEIVAEDNQRQGCISSVASCFQKACKDNMDPNDPDGSYDMCLTRPETMLSFCKIPLESCGIDASSDDNAKQSKIWDFIVARMAAMRVDSCTNEVKECLQSSDRCGKDYTQCVGLDLAAIKEMCPVEKLVGCQKDGKTASFNDTWLNSLLEGLYLSIDNALLNECQNIVNEKMIEICGDTESCNYLTSDPYIGTGSIVISRSDEGDYVMDGLISFNNVSLTKDGDLDVAEYMSLISEADDSARDRIKSVLDGVSNAVARNVAVLESDLKISMCVSGRDMSQIRGGSRDDASSRTLERFPHILDSYKSSMLDSALATAKRNYDSEYAAYLAQAISESSEYKNEAYCMAMAMGEDFVANVGNIKDSGIKETSLSKLVIYGQKTDKMLDLLTQNSDIVKIHTETEAPDSRMVARETISSVYEPGTQICRITSTIYPCTGFEGIYNSESEGWNFGVGASFRGTGGNVSGGHNSSYSKYQGNYCSSFAEPVISEQILQLSVSDQYLGTASTRSNLQSYYNDQSSYVDATSNGTSVSLDLSTGDISNIGNGKTKNSNK